MVCVPLSYLRGQYGIVRENGRGEDPLLEPVERYSQTSHKRPGKVMIVKEPNGAQAGDVVRYEVIRICRNCIHVRVAEIIIRNTSPTEASLLYFQIRTGSEGVHLVPPDGSPILERFEEGTIVGVLFVSVKPPKHRRRRQVEGVFLIFCWFEGGERCGPYGRGDNFNGWRDVFVGWLYRLVGI